MSTADVVGHAPPWTELSSREFLSEAEVREDGSLVLLKAPDPPLRPGERLVLHVSAPLPPGVTRRVRVCGAFGVEDQRPHPLPDPQGVLYPVPLVVKELRRALAHRLAILDAEGRQRLWEDRLLAYYFDGKLVAYRRRGRRVEVLAAGEEEVSELLGTLSHAERAETREGRFDW